MISRYVYDGRRLVLEYDGTNTFVARYSHGQQTDQPLAVQRAGLGFFYYHADHQGSITHLTDTSGNVANSYLYDSYGRQLNVFESVTQPFTYTGRERDAESGLYYYRARYYDPQTGRFLSEDPIGFDGFDHNLYRYVLNNPLNLNDPNGKFAFVIPAIPVLTAEAAAALTTAAHVAATVAAGAAGSVALSELNKALNNQEGAGQQGDDVVTVNPDTGEIMDPKGQTDTETGTEVPSDRPMGDPRNERMKDPCEVVLAGCLSACDKICPPKLKRACIVGCYGAYQLCLLATAPREVGN